MVESTAEDGRGRGRGRGFGGSRGGRGRGQSRGAGTSAASGRGRGGRRGGFSGSLSTNMNPEEPAQPDESTSRDQTLAKGKSPESSFQNTGQSAILTKSGAGDLQSDAADFLDGEQCFICAEPVKLYSVPPCNHKTCHICAIRLRALYKKKECTFCKEPSDTLIFTSHTDKGYLSFSAEDLKFKDERLGIFFETEQDRDETLVLLHFNCPDPLCEYAGASWPDLKAHARNEHGKVFCDLCVKNSRIFVHEHTLYASSELTKHIRTDHKHCDFCKLDFYADDELYIHMRDRHEQCFICKRHEETRDEYHRDYGALERHFRQRHYLCDAKQCLEQKFVVFETEMDFKLHQVEEHGAELSSREKRDALRVTANFHFDVNSSQARAGQTSAGSSGYTPRGKRRNDISADEADASNADPLAVSALASRNHVPGSGGPADHQGRRAMFGASLSSSTKRAEIEQDEARKTAEQERIRRTERLVQRVADLVNQSDTKVHSFRTSLNSYRAGEMGASDLVDSTRSIINNLEGTESIITGIAELLEDEEQKTSILSAWTTMQMERDNFPSLGDGPAQRSQGLNAALPTISRGQVRNIKNSSAATNRGVWVNVERAAASSGSVYRSSGKVTSLRPAQQFPSLVTSSKSTIPGSAGFSARANAASRSHVTPWSGSSSVANGSSNPTTASRSNNNTMGNSVKPFSVEVARETARSNKTSLKANSSAFPALPVNSDAARLNAQKKALFEHKNKKGTGSGTGGSSTPLGAEPWTLSGVGRIDGSGAATPQGERDLDVNMLQEHLQDAAQVSGPAHGGAKKGKQQKKVLVSLGGLHRG